MATILAHNYKGYTIRLATFQPSKVRMGGTQRSVQIIKNNCMVKTVRFNASDVYGASKACKKATAWIDEQENKTQKA